MTCKTVISILALSIASAGLSGCGGSPLDPDIVPSGYQANKANKQKPVYDVPPGYKFTPYDHKNFEDRFQDSEDKKKTKKVLNDLYSSSFNWSQIALDLALAIDREIGTDTRRVYIEVEKRDNVLSSSLDHYLRQNMIDLDYMIKPSRQDYNVFLSLRPLEQARRLEPVKSQDRGTLNGGGETAVYESRLKEFRDVEVETIIQKKGDVISKIRSIHRLSLSPAGSLTMQQ